jgi:Flp pilus assembly pilin Flp
MSVPWTFVGHLVRDREGQDLIEYALVATFVSLVMVVAVAAPGKAVDGWYGKMTARVDAAAGGSPGLSGMPAPEESRQSTDDGSTDARPVSVSGGRQTCSGTGSRASVYPTRPGLNRSCAFSF